MILEEEGGVAKLAKKSSDLGNPARLTYESVALPLSYPGHSSSYARSELACTSIVLILCCGGGSWRRRETVQPRAGTRAPIR